MRRFQFPINYKFAKCFKTQHTYMFILFSPMYNYMQKIFWYESVAVTYFIGDKNVRLLYALYETGNKSTTETHI